MKLAKKLVAGMFAADLVEPSRVWLAVLGCDNLNNVAVMKLRVERNHFAIHDGAGTCRADLAMKTIGEVERHGILWQVDDVALWGVDENLISKEIEF